MKENKEKYFQILIFSLVLFLVVIIFFIIKTNATANNGKSEDYVANALKNEAEISNNETKQAVTSTASISSNDVTENNEKDFTATDLARMLGSVSSESLSNPIPYGQNSSFVYAYGDVETKVVDRVDLTLKRVPFYILDAFEKKEWKIVLTNTLPSVEGEITDISGATIAEEKTVYLLGNEMAVDYGLVHELGHFVDAYMDFPSLSENFEAIYEAEKGNFSYDYQIGDDYEISNSVEYFACAVDEYLINSTVLSENVPRTYEYIGIILEELRGK